MCHYCILFLRYLTLSIVIGRVKTRLEEDNSPDKDLFQKNVQEFIKDVLANYKDYQLFCGMHVI